MGVHALKRRAVFLDRDGVINRAFVREGKPYPPATPLEFEILPGVPRALHRLHRAGFPIFVVTNQPDVARGTQSRQTVESMHAGLLDAGLPITSFYVCYHDSPDECACRKPRPGMLVSAGLEHAIDLGRSFIVGDRWRDIAAGQSVGCQAFFVDYGYRERRPDPPFTTVSSLAEAAEHILDSQTSTLSVANTKP